MEQCCRYVIWVRDEEGIFKRPRYAEELPENATDGYAVLDLLEHQTIVFKKDHWVRMPKTLEPEASLI